MTDPRERADELAADVARKTPDERKQALARTIQSEVAGGARVESQSDYQAVLVKGHRVNHILHLILTLITLGVWVVVWIAMVLIGGEKRRMATVDEFGNVSVARL